MILALALTLIQASAGLPAIGACDLLAMTSPRDGWRLTVMRDGAARINYAALPQTVEAPAGTFDFSQLHAAVAGRIRVTDASADPSGAAKAAHYDGNSGAAKAAQYDDGNAGAARATYDDGYVECRSSRGEVQGMTMPLADEKFAVLQFQRAWNRAVPPSSAVEKEHFELLKGMWDRRQRPR